MRVPRARLIPLPSVILQSSDQVVEAGFPQRWVFLESLGEEVLESGLHLFVQFCNLRRLQSETQECILLLHDFNRASRQFPVCKRAIVVSYIGVKYMGGATELTFVVE